MIKNILSVILFLLFVSVMTASNCNAKNIEYKIIKNKDNGITLDVYVNKLIVFSADGIMYHTKDHYFVSLNGEGIDWSYKNQPGYYYSYDSIAGNKTWWDLGYAWIDKDRKYLYLNLYHIDSPDSLSPSDINGKYDLNIINK